MDDVQTIPDVVSDAPEYRESLEDAVLRLAALSVGDYEQCRKTTAKSLDVRTIFLDAVVKDARGDDEDTGFKLYEPEPWPEEVDGEALLDRIVMAILQYVVMPEHVAEAAAIWIVHTHGYEIWQVTPRLAISAPTMGSGKSVMLDVLSAMVPRALEAANLSTAVMFRAVEKYRPTLMIDEVDTFLRDNDELRGVLNSGHRKGGSTLRCEGDANDVKAFRTFAPIATAGIGKLPGTLADRSICAELQRKKTNEHVAEFHRDRIDHLRELSRQTARWVIDNEVALREAEPTMPPGIFNRKADNWRPLLSIADAAGGDWPVRARAAAVALSATDADDAESLKVQLLTDIRAIFTAGTEDRIATKDLIAALHDMEERPWIDFRRGKPLTARQLGDMLRSFKVAARSMRFVDGRNAKGYPLSILQDVFSRYLGDSAVTPSQVNETAGYSESCAVTSDTFVTAEKHENPNVSAGCDVVTAKKGINPTFNATPENSCVVCNQPIEADQETIPQGDGELHSHCYDEWFAAMPSR
jgi:putative DNA primase/helicase